MSYLRTADAWADGVKQTLNPDGTNAGLNTGANSADPSGLVNGDIWYQSTANELRARINGATVALGAGGASPPFTDTNTLIKGSADPTKLMRFEIDGFTAGATRVLTPPDADITLAGQDFANNFSAIQTWGGVSSLETDGSLLVSGGALFSADATTTVINIGSGLIQADFGGGTVGFLSAAPVGQQAVVALINNLTMSADPTTLADFAGAVYATDSTAIRDNLYNLALKLEEVRNVLVVFGFLAP